MKGNRLCFTFRMPTKTKHNEVTLKTKYEAPKELDKNRPNKEDVIQFNVLRSTLATEKKKQAKSLLSFSKFFTETTKRVKVGTYEEIKNALLKWFTSMRGNNIPINA